MPRLRTHLVRRVPVLDGERLVGYSELPGCASVHVLTSRFTDNHTIYSMTSHIGGVTCLRCRRTPLYLSYMDDLRRGGSAPGPSS